MTIGLLTLTLFFITTAATAKQQDETTVAVPKVDERDSAIVYLTARRNLWKHRAVVRSHVIHRLWHQLRDLRASAHGSTSSSSGVPSWFLAQALCVHSGIKNGVRVGSGEGAWDADTGNGFGGGLQFMVGTWNGAARHSGGRVPYVSRTRDIARQSPATQIYAAYVIVVLENAGWGQWPNTARACGLL